MNVTVFDGSIRCRQCLSCHDAAKKTAGFPVGRMPPVQVLIDLLEIETGNDRINIGLIGIFAY